MVSVSLLPQDSAPALPSPLKFGDLPLIIPLHLFVAGLCTFLCVTVVLQIPSPRSPLPGPLCSLPPASRRDQPAAISPGCWAQKCFQLLSVGFDTSHTSGAVVPRGAQPGLPVPESCNLTAGLLQAGTATRPHLFLAQEKGRGSSRVNPEAAADPPGSHMTAPWPFCLPLPMMLPPQRSFPAPAGPRGRTRSPNSQPLGSRWSRQQEPCVWSLLVSSLLLRP